MIWVATIDYKGIHDQFEVEDCGHGEQWGSTRAISCFIFKHKIKKQEWEKLSFKIQAQEAILDGLKITMVL